MCAIALSNMVGLEYKSLILCLRYYVCDLKFRYNNSGSNFRVKFRRSPESATFRRATEKERLLISLSVPSLPRLAPCKDVVDTLLSPLGGDHRKSQL